MALTTPNLFYINAFDATKDYTFLFNVVGGSQVVANKLIIKDNLNDSVVYEQRVDTFRFEHILTANTLVNGTYYNATIITFDADGNESKPSVPVQFWCYAEPKLEFTNIPIGNIINNSSFDFEFKYTQERDEKLNSYIVNLYDSSESLVASSGIKYVIDGTPPYNGNYLFTGLQDNTVYNIQISGETINKTAIQSPMVEFTVRYLQPGFFSLIELSNNCEGGYITFKSNASLIEGEANPKPPVYIQNKEVDLTQDGSYVDYNKGYSILNDFLARLWFRSPNANSEIITFSNTENQTITVRYNEGYEEEGQTTLKAYIDVKVESLKNKTYYIYSDYINILPKDQYYNLWLLRKNNLYQIIFVAV